MFSFKRKPHVHYHSVSYYTCIVWQLYIMYVLKCVMHVQAKLGTVYVSHTSLHIFGCAGHAPFSSSTELTCGL